MQNNEFGAFIAQVGALTIVQRKFLLKALSFKGSSDDVVRLIETEFAKAPICGHCGSKELGKWGTATAMRRYMCKTCGRTFNALTGTPLAHLHKRELWLDYARALVDGVSLRKAAWRVGVHLETSFRWRHRFLAAAKTDKAGQVQACTLTGIVEADETFILKSAGGSSLPRAARRSSAVRPENVAARPRRKGSRPTNTMQF